MQSCPWRQNFRTFRINSEEMVIIALLGQPIGCQNGAESVCMNPQPRKLAMSQPEIQQLENQFPSLSGKAFAEARQRVLASGLSVLQSEGGFVYRVFPNGTKQLLKKIEPPVKVDRNKVYILQ